MTKEEMTMKSDHVLFVFLGEDRLGTLLANALCRNGIDTPEELRAVWSEDPERIKSFRTVGVTCVQRIEERLADGDQ